MTVNEHREALEIEYARLRDRADKLNDLITGKSDVWIELIQVRPHGPVEVVVDKLLAEARQTALALTSVVRALDGTALRADTPAVASAPDPSDELRQKREQKRREALAAGQS